VNLILVLLVLALPCLIGLFFLASLAWRVIRGLLDWLWVRRFLRDYRRSG